MEYIDWGFIPYVQAYEQQKEIFEAALQNKAAHQAVGNQFILCEHPHVITVGKHGLFSNLLFPEKTLKEKQVELYHVDRGGDITYHGPGQIVGYPILDLEVFHLGLKEYIHRIEEVIIRTIAGYGIKGERLDGATGVWLDTEKPGKTRKIAAIGVRSSRYVTMHGFAFNVNTDLSYFKLINPCGFTDKGVTSLQQESGQKIDIDEIKAALRSHFDLFFSAE
ncbi:octanoyltransferase [Bacteroidia bacterium]|nr:octanoyltransferase [Bacteroidia bacterium]GHT05186.1 octanoyltransferase [Bacteroidia bacterium]GHT50041.1 octanoyltransferase [Bacteroidia bacterium]